MSWNQKNQIPKDVLQAFDNLKSDRSLAVVIAWLRTGLKEEDIATRTQIDETLLRMGQGRAQVLDLILYANDNAREVLLKLMNQKAQPNMLRSATGQIRQEKSPATESADRFHLKKGVIR